MKKILFTLLFATSLFGTSFANDTITGFAQAGDGDDLVIEGQKIRLQGIDAPEWHQICELENGKEFYPGREAQAWLQSMVSNQMVSCHVEATDRYKRKVATCYVNGININEALMRQGFAFANSKYSERYEEFEKEARADKKGLWRGTCEQPWVWRKKNPR